MDERTPSGALPMGVRAWAAAVRIGECRHEGPDAYRDLLQVACGGIAHRTLQRAIRVERGLRDGALRARVQSGRLALAAAEKISLVPPEEQARLGALPWRDLLLAVARLPSAARGAGAAAAAAVAPAGRCPAPLRRYALRGWRDIGVHPFAAALAPARPAERRDIEVSLRLLGYDPERPIYLHRGMVVDGRARLDACRKLGVDPVFADVPAAGLASFVLAANVARRHLTDSQRSWAAGLSLERWLGDRDGRTRASAAFIARLREIAGMGPRRQIRRVQRLLLRLKSGIIRRRLANGEITIDVAELIADLPPEDQSKIEGRGPEEISRAASRLGRRRQGKGRKSAVAGRREAGA